MEILYTYDVMFDSHGGAAIKPSDALYRHLVADAWRTVRKNKSLWLLGFFVSFLGNGGVYELLIQGTGRLGLQDSFGQFLTLGLLPGQGTISQALAKVGAGNVMLLLLVGLTALGLVIVAAWVIISAQGGLIAGIRDAGKGRKVTFKSAFASGNEVFGPLLALNLLSRLAIMAFFYLLLSLTVLYLYSANIWNVLAYLAGFLILVPLTLIIGFVTIYAACYIALQRMPFVAALETAFALFRKYWLISLETSFVLFAVNFLTAICIGLVMGIGGVALIPFVIGASLLGNGPAMAVVVAVAGVAAVAFLAVIGSGLAAFQYAVWIHLFTKLHQRGHGARPKLERWFDKLLK
jgi:hypothetical protein